MSKQILSEEFRRMLRLAGLLNENTDSYSIVDEAKYPKDNDEFIEYIKKYVEDNDIKTPGELRQQNIPLYQTIQNRKLADKVYAEIFPDYSRSKYPVNTKEFIKYVKNYIEDNDIKTVGELQKQNNGLYQTIRNRGLSILFTSKELFPDNLRTKSNTQYPIDNEAFVRYVVDYVKDNNIKIPGELRQQNTPLYQTIHNRGLVDQVYSIAFPGWSKYKYPKDDEEFIKYVTNYVGINDITTPGELQKQNTPLYSAIYQRKLNKEIFPELFPRVSKRKYPKDDEEFVKYIIDYIKTNNITTPSEFYKQNISLYNNMHNRGLVYQVFPNYKRKLSDEEFIEQVTDYVKNNDIKTVGELIKKNASLYSLINSRKLGPELLPKLFPDYKPKKLNPFRENMKIKEIRQIIREELEYVLREQIEEDDIMDQLKLQLAKVGIDKVHPGAFKLVDKRKGTAKPNTITYMSVDKTGEIKPEENMDEGLKDKIMAGVVCTILATGMVSCTKENTAGFGYNVNSKATEYVVGKGTPNKKVTISTPQGDEEVEVDSTMGDTKYYFGSQPLKFGRPMTPTEALIIKIGHAYQTEKNQNNRKTNRKWDYDPENSEITGGGTMYQDNETPFENARQHPLFDLGLEAAKNAGKDVQALLQKADKEVQDQNWVK